MWKFLAEHAGHPLRVLVEGEQGYDEMLADSREIGGDTFGDVSFEDYLGNDGRFRR